MPGPLSSCKRPPWRYLAAVTHHYGSPSTYSVFPDHLRFFASSFSFPLLAAFCTFRRDSDLQGVLEEPLRVYQKHMVLARRRANPTKRPRKD